VILFIIETDSIDYRIQSQLTSDGCSSADLRFFFSRTRSFSRTL
jgi:hypothetical protein